MTPRRSGSENGTPDIVNRADDTPVVAQAMRIGGEALQSSKHGPKSDEERMSLFWRVFGGTILSISALVAVTLFNNLSGTIADLRGEIAKANEARAAAVVELRQELAKAAEARADFVRKDEFSTRMTSNWDRVQALQQQNNSQNANLTSLKTETDGLKERLAKQAVDADAVRKDVAALEAMKEKVAGLCADLKASRDETMKLRGDVDRNQAADMERKLHRDSQYKQIDDTLKELQKALLECREKIARLEGSAAMPPKKDRPAAGPQP